MIEWENIKGTTILYHNTHSYLCLETIAKYVEGNYIKEPHKFGIHFAQTHTATINHRHRHRHMEGKILKYWNFCMLFYNLSAVIEYSRLRQSSSQIIYILVLCDYFFLKFPQYCQSEEATIIPHILLNIKKTTSPVF
jgi:hypothetical protein